MLLQGVVLLHDQVATGFIVNINEAILEHQPQDIKDDFAI